MTRRSWYPTERALYAPPGTGSVGSCRPAAHVVWLRFGCSVPGRHVLLVTDALRGAVMSACDPDGSGDVPDVVHGHGTDSAVSWLALPTVGNRYADGTVLGAAVAVPHGTDPEAVERVRAAAQSVKALRLKGGQVVPVSRHAGQSRPWAVNPSRWTRPSTRFVSAFPVVHERRTRNGTATMADVAAWCAHAGLPEPVAARTCRPAMIKGAVSLDPHETTRRPSDRRPYEHLAVEFAEPVAGPVSVGRLRRFGLGLLVPVHGTDSA